MKRVHILFGLLLFLANDPALAQQWSGASTTTGIIYRTGIVGIGLTGPTRKLHVLDNQAGGSTFLEAARIERVFGNTASASQDGLAAQTEFTGTSGATASIMNGSLGTVKHSGAGTVTNARGLMSTVWLNSSGNITDARSIMANWAKTGTGTIQTGYGIYLVDVPATTGYGIYQVGTNDKNYFAGSVGIGTTNPTYPLAVNGTIRAKEIIVNTGWADFVFEDEYVLMTLEEVEDYIEEYGRLPGMPSEAEVENNGIPLGDINAKLLQKIEELTLYLIWQNKEINRLATSVRQFDVNLCASIMK